jgi:hypothetical protein
MNPENPMQRTPLQTLLEERLRSARGLGWDMPPAAASVPVFRRPVGTPRWFRITYLTLRSLGLVRG